MTYKETNERIKYYRESCYKYGFLTLCYLIDRYARQEKYQECSLVLQALREIDSSLPTKWDIESIAYFRKEIKKITGKDGTHAIMNLPDYADEIMAGLPALSPFDKILQGLLSVPKPIKKPHQ